MGIQKYQVQLSKGGVFNVIVMASSPKDAERVAVSQNPGSRVTGLPRVVR